jgi:acyl-CoA thioesterase
LTQGEYILARIVAQLLDDPVEARRACRRLHWVREKTMRKDDPAYNISRLAYISGWKRAKRQAGR